jgi:gliding motility-associated-like protein
MKQFLVLVVLACYSAIIHAQTPPTAQFTGAPLSVCLGQAINFTNLSTNGTGNITTWAWDFGDGNSSTQTNTSHTYASPGTYTVTLVVQASNGQADAEVKTNYVTVNPIPIASYSTSTNGCSLPVAVTFNNTSTGATSYAWNFGNTQTSTLQSPNPVNYSIAGTYNASLIVTNSFGCKDTMLQSLVISNFQAGITAPNTACQNTAVAINDNSTVGANAWNWTFNGGSPGTSSNEDNTVTFATPGTYTISLTSQNTGSGCSATTTKQITILPTPTPSFNANPSTGCAPLAVNFTNTSPAGSNFVWSFGDGQTFNGQNPPPHTYLGNGTYNVTLTMTGSNGCPGTVTLPAVTLTSPVSNFSSDVVNGCAPLSVQFTDGSTSADPITTWVWTFGDGTSFTGQTPPPHAYTVGVYDVTLTVTTQNGCLGTLTMPDFIQVGQIDQVNFSINATPECAKTSINFTDLSVITAPHQPSEVTYAWNFGDGGTAASQNPSHSYTTDTGYFDVSLVVTFRGCSDTLSMNDAVYIKAPISFFTPAQTLYCNPASFPVNVAVDDDSRIGKLSDNCFMIWKWGDGTFSNLDDPDFDDLNLGSTSHNYSTYGTYVIEQVIYNYTTGCSDSTSQTIYISQTIAGIAALANDSVCVGSNFTLTDNSTSSHPFGTYSWDMGNNQVVTGSTPTYAYPGFGTYTITLTATNSVGCSDDATFAPMTALALPQALIAANDNTGCAPFLVSFSNGSTVQNNGVPLSSFTFSFPDDNSTQTTTSVGTNVTHTFHTEGTFPVSLIATDQFGCVSPATSTVITITKPVALFSVDSVVCEAESVTAVNNTTGTSPINYQWYIDGIPSGINTDLTTSFNEPSNPQITSVNHQMVLIATDVNGCKDTLNKEIIVSTPAAIIDFTLDGAATNANGDFLCPPVFADFTDNSNSFGTITNYNWVFGDGKTSTLPNPNNTYVFPGTYSVGLTVTNEYGCVSDTTLIDFLTVYGPIANPSWSAAADPCGQTVSFDLGTNSNITTINWNLGDGTHVLDSISFTHTYLDVTTYLPSVTVFDSNDCQVIYPMNPVVIPDNGLDAHFTPDAVDLQLGESVTFVDQSTSDNPIVSWTWDLGNSPTFTNPTGSNVSSVYVLPGAIQITLLIEDNLGCFDTYDVTIHVDGNFNMPNVITPNGDGINDVFSFYYDIFETFDILIVNRWGTVMKEAKNQTGTTFWDGKTKSGDPANDGVYFYKFHALLKDGTPLDKDGFLEVFGNN